MACRKCGGELLGFSGACVACGRTPVRGIPPSGVVGAAVALILTLFAFAVHAERQRAFGSSRNIHSNRLERMPWDERSRAFARMMKDDGEECPAVRRFFFRGDIGPNAFWNIRCSDGGEWMISIAANSWTRVTGCEKLKIARTPCWTKL